MLCIPDIICSRKGNSFESKMHWLLWLSLTEAEPNNVSRLKHLSCLLYGHKPLQTPSLDFKTWTEAEFHHGDCYRSHIVLCEFSVKFGDVQEWGEAMLMEPGCQAHLCFYSKASSEEGAGMPRAGVRGMRALDHSFPWKKDIPAPFSSSSTATVRTSTCSMGNLAAICGLGQKLRGLAWREEWSDRGMGQAASLYFRHKAKKKKKIRWIFLINWRNYLTYFSKY